MASLSSLRSEFRDRRQQSELQVVESLLGMIEFSDRQTTNIYERAAGLVNALRDEAKPGLMESFLAEYGLSTDEGVALMCLAEAYLRTPDDLTMDALIRDKIGAGPVVQAPGWCRFAICKCQHLGLDVERQGISKQKGRRKRSRGYHAESRSAAR